MGHNIRTSSTGLPGKGGERIQRIQSDSRCGVNVDSSNRDRSNPLALVDVTLTGTDEQILMAVVSFQCRLVLLS